jgi:multidrug efflux pump subunit AcrB
MKAWIACRQQRRIEIAMPIISTLTTVAAFVPLGLWPGVMGQFMVYFPITLSVVLAVRCL